MNQGDYLKNRGLDLVESNNVEFVAALRKEAIKLIKKHGQVSIDELRAFANMKRIKPKHCNCFGAIFRSKEFKSIGFKKSQLPSNHSRVVGIWGLA